MPVLPDVASMMVSPSLSRPDDSPSAIIRDAARSFTDPPGFCHSALAYSSTPGVSRSNRGSRTSGVRPMRSTTDEAVRPSDEDGDDVDDMNRYATVEVRIIASGNKPMSKGDGSDMLSALVEPSQKPGALERAGGWLFRQRTWLPVPIAVALLLIPPDDLPQHLSTSLVWLGVPIVALGELLRLWAVHHIGVISRTRSDRLGPLIDTGPFSLVRNPLYLGNILLWVGFAVSARLLWLAPVIVAVLAFEYHTIVKWEEGLLTARIGAAYGDYTRRVPRWVPAVRVPSTAQDAARFSWRDTLYRERGTLIAIATAYLLLWFKSRL